MKGCFENIDAAVGYIKYISLDNLNVSVKLYREAGCWYVEGYGQTVCKVPPSDWMCTRVTENQIPYIGSLEVNHLMNLAEEAGAARIHENIIQMTKEDLERFIYLYGEGY